MTAISHLVCFWGSDNLERVDFILNVGNFMCQKEGDNMYQNILKAGKTEQYFTVAAMTSYLKEKEKYEGLLLIKEKGEVCSKYGASEIRIFSKRKSTLYKQLQQIAALYPPQQDIKVIDMEALLYE
ncbi:MAG: hypothetical protein U0N90_02970 [Blautia sp.]|jgi:hypothetical protein